MSPEIEQHLITRLTALNLFRTVQPVADIATKNVSAQITPAAYVGYDGFDIDSTSTDSTAVKLTERWIIVIVVKSSRQNDGGQEVREEGLTLAKAAFEALIGFIPPEPRSKELVPVTPPPPFWDSGFFWIPLAFTRKTILNAKE